MLKVIPKVKTDVTFRDIINRTDGFLVHLNNHKQVTILHEESYKGNAGFIYLRNFSGAHTMTQGGLKGLADRLEKIDPYDSQFFFFTSLEDFCKVALKEGWTV